MRRCIVWVRLGWADACARAARSRVARDVGARRGLADSDQIRTDSWQTSQMSPSWPRASANSDKCRLRMYEDLGISTAMEALSRQRGWPLRPPATLLLDARGALLFSSRMRKSRRGASGAPAALARDGESRDGACGCRMRRWEEEEEEE